MHDVESEVVFEMQFRECNFENKGATHGSVTKSPSTIVILVLPKRGWELTLYSDRSPVRRCHSPCCSVAGIVEDEVKHKACRQSLEDSSKNIGIEASMLNPGLGEDYEKATTEPCDHTYERAFMLGIGISDSLRLQPERMRLSIEDPLV